MEPMDTGERFAECSECGHLHFNADDRKYEPCPIEGCTCPLVPRSYDWPAPLVTTDRGLERAAERFADTMHEAIAARVKWALAAERERMDADLAELRDELHELSRQTTTFAAKQVAFNDAVIGSRDLLGLHSVKVEP